MRGVAFSPDRRRVATVSQDGTIRVWNVDGTTAFTLSGHPGGARTVRYAADGRWLIGTGSDGTVRICRPAPPPSRSSSAATVVSATMSHDGTRVATVHSDGTARLAVRGLRTGRATPAAGPLGRRLPSRSYAIDARVTVA